MKVLVACEESQRVCTAFRERGHEAYSCDIIEPSGGHPEWHILGDALEAIKGGAITTMDGESHDVGKWDMLIAHPPCTYLTNAGTRSFSLRVTPAEKVCARWNERAKAVAFFMQFILADIPKTAVENPVGYISTAYRKPDQVIHPYMFANGIDDTEQYVTKATCLWLKGLPVLRGGQFAETKQRGAIRAICKWQSKNLGGFLRAECKRTFKNISRDSRRNGRTVGRA